MHSEEQQELDFHAPVGNGYESRQWDREQAVKRISETWGLPVNCEVRLKLAVIDGEFTGKLILDRMPANLNRREPFKLRLGRMTFLSTEIEKCFCRE